MIKRLAAGLLAFGLLAVSAVESFHAHAAKHSQGCAACVLEAAPAAASAPVAAPRAVASFSLVVPAVIERPSVAAVSPKKARAPPAV